MALSRAVKRKLGDLADHANQIAREVIRQRGGTASNVKFIGEELANCTLEEIAKKAIAGDPSAETAIKVIKQAKRLGKKSEG